MSFSKSEKITLEEKLQKAGFNNQETKKIVETITSNNTSHLSELIEFDNFLEIEKSLAAKVGSIIKNEHKKTRRWVIALFITGFTLLVIQIAPYVFYFLMYLKAKSLLG